MPPFTGVVEGIGLVVDGAGVLAIVLGLLLATLRFAAAAFVHGRRRQARRKGGGRRPSG
jgi:hypothetical protein